jgi:DNA-binding NtrC family response regulator
MTSTSPGPHRVPRVLIVEDESRLRDLLLEEIPDMGFPATAVRSGEEARRIMESDAHEIMLLDLRLPVMGGMDLLESVRKSWPQTQVVILTGYGDLASAQRAIHLDVVDFLSKPCRLREVELALDRARRRISSPIPVVPEEIPELPKAKSPEDPKIATLKQAERDQIMAALARNNGNRTAAALELGISRRTLHYRISQYRQQGGDSGSSRQ